LIPVDFYLREEDFFFAGASVADRFFALPDSLFFAPDAALGLSAWDFALTVEFSFLEVDPLDFFDEEVEDFLLDSFSVLDSWAFALLRSSLCACVPRP